MQRLAVHWKDHGLWWQRRLLQAFLEAPLCVAPPPGRLPRNATAWIGWGRRPSGRRATRLAQRDGVKCLLLEDGFLRSHGLAVLGAQPLSIVADTSGVHYDATAPSDIETMLEHGDFSTAELQQATRALHLLRQEGLSKYNTGLPVPAGIFPADEEHVLVVDQTAGDMSLHYGLANDDTCRSMLEAALEENPHAIICVKTHPDVLAGRRHGALPCLQHPRLRWLTDNWHPHDLLMHFRKVYVATSLMGLDALLLEREVHCFGLPFYAGWGLTKDRQRSERRTARRTLTELVAAAFLRYPRYIHPLSGKRCDFFTVAKHIAHEKHQRRFWTEEVAGPPWTGRVHVFGFRIWKHAQTRPFFGEQVELRFSRNLQAARRKGLRRGDRIAVWGYRDPPGLAEAARRLGTSIVRVEDGFLRSVGLGSDFIAPLSLVFDPCGLYFDPSSDSRLQHILQHHHFDDELLREAARLRRFIVEHGLSKYNLPRRALHLPPQARGRRIVLVPGQVETDAAVRLGGGGLRSNAALLQQVREHMPDAWIIYKPHPDVLAHNRAAGDEAAEQALADQVETHADILSCIEACDEVHTISSLSGFDALLRERKVATYGTPFYAGWGLTHDHAPLPQRGRKLSLDALVAGALLIYPRYHTGPGGNFITAEEAARLLLERRRAQPFPTGMERQLMKWGAFTHALAHSLTQHLLLALRRQ